MTYIGGTDKGDHVMDIQDALEFAKLLRHVAQAADERDYGRGDILIMIKNIAANYEREAACIEAEMEREAA